MDINFTYTRKAFYTLVVSFLLLHICCGLAAQVKFQTVVTPTEALPKEYIQLDYVIENAESVDDFATPTFNRFKIVQGPSQSSSTTVINGTVSRSNTISYILQPLDIGKFAIPGATAIINGKTMRSNSVAVTITESASSRRTAPVTAYPFAPDAPRYEEDVSEEYRLGPGEDAVGKIARNLMVKLEVNKYSCYVGEPMIATYKLYSRLRSESRITKRPSLNGFSVYDMEDPRTQRTIIEKLKGKAYNMHIIRRTQLMPLQAGSFVLDPMELENKVEFVRLSASDRQGSGNPMQRMMDEFFGNSQPGNAEEHNIAIKSDPITITVKPLPEEGRPEAFNGAVGKFTITASLKKNVINAGDVAEMEVTINGAGNLPMINPPRLDLPLGMEVFDPAVKENVNKTVYPLQGFKQFNYTFLVKEEGDYRIPPVRFAYFDPAASAYKTMYSDSFSIHVNKSTLAATKQPADTVAGNRLPATVSSNWIAGISKQFLAAAVFIVVLIALIIIMLLRAVKKSPAAKQGKMPETHHNTPLQPDKTPLPAISLKEAGVALSQGKSQEFYSEINKAVREAVYRKTAKGPTEMTKFNMPFILREKGVPVHTIQELEDVIRDCEIALYTPIHEEKDMKNILEKAGSVIKDL